MSTKNWINNKITSLKLKIKEYFLLENSLEHIENFIKKYYVLPLGFNDIYYGNKDIKRLKIFIINWAFGWFAVGYYLSFIFSDKMFSLIRVPSISDGNLKLLWTLGVIILLLTAVIRTDYLFGEINYNLNPLKVIYYLMKDLKQLHKLNEKNYKKLAILSRSIQILFMDCGTFLIAIAGTLSTIMIVDSSGKILWTCVIIIIFILIYIKAAATGFSSPCLFIIMLYHYIMIFDQINHEINSISNENQSTFFKRRKIIINKTKQRQLISLINEHNLAASEIHKFNLILRRTVGCVFITFAMMKIISLYLIVHFNGFFILFFLMQFNFITLIFGFAGSYLLTLQIKSAHQSLKTVYSFVCKYEMDLRLKLKVSQLIIIY